MPSAAGSANPRTRYALDTLLSTLGVPYHFAGGAGSPAGAPDRAGLQLPMNEENWGASGITPKRDRVLALSSEDVDLARVAAFLAREEEYGSSQRDEHDRFQWSHSLVSSEGTARPWVSEKGQNLLAALKEACVRSDLPMVRKEFWPGGRAIAACLTHDVDVVRRGRLPRGVAVRDVAGALRSAASGRWRSATHQISSIARTASSGVDPYWTFDRISGLERSHGYRSTYFFMSSRLHPADALYDVGSASISRLTHQLAESGCEIGLHGSYASPANADSVREQKEQLEKRIGTLVSGHRNHLLRFRAPQSWRAQESAGFSYDATLGFADHEGFRGGHAFPFHPYDLLAEQEMELLEIPLAVMDVSILEVPAAEGGGRLGGNTSRAGADPRGRWPRHPAVA